MAGDDDQSFIEKLKVKQAKDEKNRQQQGDGHPEKKLPNNQH
jgi:hypothetical protein